MTTQASSQSLATTRIFITFKTTGLPSLHPHLPVPLTVMHKMSLVFVSFSCVQTCDETMKRLSCLEIRVIATALGKSCVFTPLAKELNCIDAKAVLPFPSCRLFDPTTSLLLAVEHVHYREKPVQGDNPAESYLIFCGLVCRLRARRWFIWYHLWASVRGREKARTGRRALKLL